MVYIFIALLIVANSISAYKQTETCINAIFAFNKKRALMYLVGALFNVVAVSTLITAFLIVLNRGQ